MRHGRGHYLKLLKNGEGRRVLVHDPPGHEGRSLPWVAAIAAVAGAPVWGEAPARPVPTLAFHGTEDRHIPYAGGVGPLGRSLPALPVREALGRWAALMGCGAEPDGDVLDAHRLDLWPGDTCEVGLWSVAGMGHAWPGGRAYAPGADVPVKDLSATHLIWAFFERHPLEGA